MYTGPKSRLILAKSQMRVNIGVSEYMSHSTFGMNANKREPPSGQLTDQCCIVMKL